MKNYYFKYIEIEKEVMLDLFTKHPKLCKYIDTTKPFYVRIFKKTYPGLLHLIIEQNETSDNVGKISGILDQAFWRINAKVMSKVDVETLTKLVGNKEKAQLIKNISEDVVNKKLDLKDLSRQSEQDIVNRLTSYKGLEINTAKQYALFACFKQNILCYEDQSFIDGLKIYLNKDKIDNSDIQEIIKEYDGQLTLFSLCMWRMKNEKVG